MNAEIVLQGNEVEIILPNGDRYTFKPVNNNIEVIVMNKPMQTSIHAKMSNCTNALLLTTDADLKYPY